MAAGNPVSSDCHGFRIALEGEAQENQRIAVFARILRIFLPLRLLEFYQTPNASVDKADSARFAGERHG